MSAAVSDAELDLRISDSEVLKSLRAEMIAWFDEKEAAVASSESPAAIRASSDALMLASVCQEPAEALTPRLVALTVVPVIVGDSLRAVRLSNDLLAAGVNVLPIIHPAVPEGQARLRFFITSEHDESQIRETVALTAELLDGLVRDNFGLNAIDPTQIARLLSGT